MKQRWQKLAARIDALSQRERALLFAALVALVVFAAYFAALGPLLRKQSALRAQISQQQNNIAGMDGEILQKLREYERDPDAADRARLAAVKAESAQLGESLSAMQKGLVAPERMAPLIDTILRANGRLKLVAMRTLPVTSLNDAPGGAAAPASAPAPEPKNATVDKLETIRKQVANSVPRLPAPGESLAPVAPATTSASAPAASPPASAVPVAAVAPKAGSLLYRHGVEITVRGSYLDMIDYMTALESMPTQLFWGGAKLEVEDYPTARLTLTMYTLSLDSKWLKL